MSYSLDPAKALEIQNMYKKLGNVFTSFRKSSAGEQVLVYLQCQNKKVMSNGPSLLFSTVVQGNGQDNISYGKSINDFKLSSPFLKVELVLQICFEDLLLLIPAYILQSHSSVSS